MKRWIEFMWCIFAHKRYHYKTHTTLCFKCDGDWREPEAEYEDGTPHPYDPTRKN